LHILIPGLWSWLGLFGMLFKYHIINTIYISVITFECKVDGKYPTFNNPVIVVIHYLFVCSGSLTSSYCTAAMHFFKWTS